MTDTPDEDTTPAEPDPVEAPLTPNDTRRWARPGGRFPLEQPWTRRQLILRMVNDLNDRKLAKEYGVHSRSMEMFRKRHKQEILDARKLSEDEFVNLWISDKANRIAVYQDEILRAVAAGDTRAVTRILRNVAEEMGHLPSRMQLSGSVDVRTSYSIVGEDGAAIDLKDLR